MKKLIATSMFLLFVGSISFGQQSGPERFCGTYEHQKEIFETHPELEDSYYAHRLLMNSKMTTTNKSGEKASSYTIPVVFHILHEYGVENITDAQVYDAMEVINREFNAADPDSVNVVAEYAGLIGNGNIEFKLAALDPYGNCTNGIEHIYSHETRNGDAFSKISQWNRARYLNIWVVDVIGVSGAAAYAVQPSGTDGNFFWLDGIVSNHEYVGSIGTSQPFHETTLTHEIGHYLSLDHVWGGTNDPEVACGDDGVPDTPITQGHSPGTNCPGLYPIGWVDCQADDIVVDSLDMYTFDSLTLVSGTSDITPIPAPENDQTNATAVIFSSFDAVGVGSNPTHLGSFSFDGWDTGALDGETVYANLTGVENTAKYYEFTVQPVFGQRMTLTDIYFEVARDTLGPRTYAVRSSVDGYAANLTPSIFPLNSDITIEPTNVFFFANDSTNFFPNDSTSFEVGSTVALSGAAYNTDSNTPITFRIYAWNAEDAAGDFAVDNVQVGGTFGLLEDLQNYMDYSYCPYHYTPNQVEFMQNALNEIAGQRNNLWIDTTLELTGVKDLLLPQDPANELTVPLCEPVSDFNSSTRNVCINTPMSFYDASWNATVDSWEWTFQDGSPATSTDQNPTVSFTSAGYKTVTLKAKNAASVGGTADPEVRTGYIYVSNEWGDFNGPNSIDMEDGTVNWFVVNNPEENYAKFALSSGTGYDGSRSWKLNNFKDVSNADPFNDDYFYNNRLGLSEDHLITPSFDLRYTTGVTVSFKYSYATNATQVNQIDERLLVKSSKDCGATWQTRKTIFGAPIVTGGYAGYSDYAPSTNQDWVTASFVYTPDMNDEHTRFMFVFEATDLASNLYIDDINVDGTLSLVSDEIALLDLNVFPNPTTNGQAITVTYTANNEPVTFTLRDAQGKLIATERIEETNAMVNHTLKGSNDLNSGCYFIEVSTGEHTTTRKVVVL
jgi:hypothetical protein